MTRKKKKLPTPPSIPGSDQFELETIQSAPDAYTTRVKPPTLRKTSLALNTAWSTARRTDYWAQSGFLTFDEAADAWAVAGDAAEDIGAVTRSKEARRLELSFRDFEGPMPATMEGPLLPWPEVQRWTTNSRRDLYRLFANSRYGKSASESPSKGVSSFYDLNSPYPAANATRTLPRCLPSKKRSMRCSPIPMHSCRP